MSWDDARTNCQSYYVKSTDEGYDLASITTPDEEAYISTLITDSTWHGLTDMAEEGEFKFIDGTTYNNTTVQIYGWASGEPNAAIAVKTLL